MSAGSFQIQDLRFYPVDQKPVRFNVTISESGEIPDKRVVSVFCFKRDAFSEASNDRLYFLGVFASSDQQLYIFPKLVTVTDGKHQIPKR